MSFSDDIKKFAEKTGKKADQSAVAILFKLNELVVKRTPVDTGRARGGWVASLGSISLTAGAPNKSGQNAINKCNAVAKKAPGTVYYLINTVKYISILEHGGYPIPGGSKTSGGYSLQAPRGMMRISVDEVKQEVNRIIGNGY